MNRFFNFLWHVNNKFNYKSLLNGYVIWFMCVAGMKDFVTANPYISKSNLGSCGTTPFLILACDGNLFFIYLNTS